MFYLSIILFYFIFLKKQLVFNRQKLIEILDQDIQEAGLQNAAVNVQFA